MASATGPVLGGLLIALFGLQRGWRSIFLVNVPIGLVALVLVLLWVPKRRHRATDADTGLDLVGAGLLGAAVLCLLLPTVEAQSESGPAFLVLIGAPLFGAAFVWWERRLGVRGRAPLLDVALLRRTPGYASGLAVGAVYFTGFTGIFLVLTVFFQQALRYSALQTGLLLTPFALAPAISSPIAGRLDRWIAVYALAGRRIGSAFGAALLVTAYRPAAEALDPAGGVRLSLVCALLVAAAALGLAVRDTQRCRTQSQWPPR